MQTSFVAKRGADQWCRIPIYPLLEHDTAKAAIVLLLIIGMIQTTPRV
jgi:hypothetical protein